MDGVDQQRAAARLAAPGNVEIIRRLLQQPQGRHRGQPADAAALHDLARLLEDRIVAAVVADQQRHPLALRCLY